MKSLSALVILLSVFLILGLALLDPSAPVGVADNGDFWRVTNKSGLIALENPGRYILNPFYSIGRSTSNDYFTSTLLISESSKLFSFVFGVDKQNYTIQQMGLTYLLLLFGTALLFFCFSPVLAVLFLLPFLDSRYYIYFNSFFSFPLMFFIFYAICYCYLKIASERLANFLLLILGSLICLGFLCAHQFLLLPLCSLFLYGFRFNKNFSSSAKFILLVAAVLLTSLGAFYRYTNNNFSDFNRFDSIFSGPPLVYNFPEEALRRLEIDPSLWRLVGAGFFSDQVYFNPDKKVLHEIQEAHLEKVSKWQLARAYIATPSSFWRLLTLLKGAFLDYHSEGHGSYPFATSPPDLKYAPPWSLFHIRLALSGFLGESFFLLFVLHGFFLVALLIKKRSAIIELSLFLYLFSCSQILTSLLGSGFFGLGRHLLVGAFCYDLCVLATIYGTLLACIEPKGHRAQT